MKKVSLIGLGAIGCAYASKLHDFNPEGLSIIADEKRIKRYSEGLIINGKRYDFNYVLPSESCAYDDLIIISVKFYQLEEAIKAIKNHVGPNTIILSLLNGISSEEIIGKVYGMDKLLYGMCVGIDAVREENTVEFSNSGEINFGEKSNKIYSPKVIAVKELFDKANIKYAIPEDMIYTLWWKYMVNIGINQCSAVLNATYSAFQSIDEAKVLMESAMKEVIAVSKKLGINLDEARDINTWYSVLDSLSPNGKTSMLQDIQAGRKTEVEMFSGALCSLGEKYGVPTPVNKTLYNIIKSLENMALTI